MGDVRELLVVVVVAGDVKFENDNDRLPRFLQGSLCSFLVSFGGVAAGSVGVGGQLSSSSRSCCCSSCCCCCCCCGLPQFLICEGVEVVVR